MSIRRLEKAERRPLSANCDGPEHPSDEMNFRNFSEALCSVALEDLEVAKLRYRQHMDPVRCAVCISLVLHHLASELYGERRVLRIQGVRWLNFLVRTSSERTFQPHVIETMSAALYAEPSNYELPRDCGFWFQAAERWIRDQAEKPAHITVAG